MFSLTHRGPKHIIKCTSDFWNFWKKQTCGRIQIMWGNMVKGEVHFIYDTSFWTQVLMRMKKLCKEQKTTNMNYEHEQNKKRWKALQTRLKLMIPSSKNKQVHKTIKTFAKYTLGSWRLLQTSLKPRIQVKQMQNLKTLATHMACSINAKLTRAFAAEIKEDNQALHGHKMMVFKEMI